MNSKREKVVVFHLENDFKASLVLISLVNAFLAIFSSLLAQYLAGGNPPPPLPVEIDHQNMTSATANTVAAIEYDLIKTLHFCLFSVITTPAVCYWYEWLGRTFPIRAGAWWNRRSTLKQVGLRVLMDQLCFAPLSLALMLIWMALLKFPFQNPQLLPNWITEDVNHHIFQKEFPQILLVNYYVWPFVQFVNFLLVPLQYRVVFVNVVGVVWNLYLCWPS